MGQQDGGCQSDQLESETEQGLQANGGDGHAEENLATTASTVSIFYTQQISFVIYFILLPRPEYEKMYNMTVLAVQLNEPEPGVAPTDSRLRPDQRLMEEAKWDEANEAKGRLEDKQRVVRRLREEEAERAAAEGRGYQAYEPIWFKVSFWLF